VKKKLLEWWKSFLIKRKQAKCKHYFRVADFGSRDKTGYLEWPCSRCGKVFRESCGLDVLVNGKCDGKWGN